MILFTQGDSRLSIKWRVALPLLALAFIIALGVAAPAIAPYDPLFGETGQELKPPSTRYALGTDWAGRDVLSRVLYGGRLTLGTALISVALAIIPGLIVGILAGYIGSWLDQVIVAVLDALLAFPGLLIALSIVALMGNGSLQVAVAVGLAGFPAYARVTRAAALATRTQPYIEAARATGVTPLRLLVFHLLPNMLSTLIAFGTVTLSWAILNAATLNFLGFGGDPSLPEWGALLAEGRQTFRVAPWATLAPGVAIMLTLLAVNLLSDALTHRNRSE
ncbi:MAG: ABC transporter permease [Chloroflexota bacterium]